MVIICTIRGRSTSVLGPEERLVVGDVVYPTGQSQAYRVSPLSISNWARASYLQHAGLYSSSLQVSIIFAAVFGWEPLFLTLDISMEYQAGDYLKHHIVGSSQGYRDVTERERHRG